MEKEKRDKAKKGDIEFLIVETQMTHFTKVNLNYQEKQLILDTSCRTMLNMVPAIEGESPADIYEEFMDKTNILQPMETLGGRSIISFVISNSDFV